MPHANNDQDVHANELAVAGANGLGAGGVLEPASSRTSTQHQREEYEEHSPELSQPSSDDNDVEKGPPGDVELSRTVSSGPPYTIFSRRMKQFIVFMAMAAGFFSPFSANIYFPALDQIAADLHITNALVNLTLTTYMIFQGLAPSTYSSTCCLDVMTNTLYSIHGRPSRHCRPTTRIHHWLHNIHWRMYRVCLVEVVRRSSRLEMLAECRRQWCGCISEWCRGRYLHDCRKRSVHGLGHFWHDDWSSKCAQVLTPRLLLTFLGYRTSTRRYIGTVSRVASYLLVSYHIGCCLHYPIDCGFPGNR